MKPFLPFGPDETPISYANRFSEFHTGRPFNDMAKGFGFEPLDMLSNKTSALSRLSEISGVPEGDMRHNTPVSLGERKYDLRGEIVTAEFLASPKIVFCPACLHEDDQTGARRARWPWSLAVVRTCAVHKLPLQCASKGAWNHSLLSLGHTVPERGENLKALAKDIERREPSPLQNYVLTRLERQTGPRWLDEQTLDQAVRATELLGVLLVFGPDQLLPDLGQDDWDIAGSAGYAVTSQGEGAIRLALEEQFSKFSMAEGSPGPRKIFGCFYTALAHSKTMKDPGDIARILREFIWDRIAMPTGTKVLGQKLPERRLHTVASLAKEAGQDSRRLYNMLVGARVIPTDAAAHFAIPVQVGREMAARVKRIVNVTRLPQALNCTRPMANHLCNERLLTPIYYGTPSFRGKLQKGVDRDEISALLDELSARSVPNLAVTGLVKISKAAEKAKVPAVCVVQMVRAGFLQHVARVEDVPGIEGMRVCPSEVKKVVKSTLVGMTASEAFAALKLNFDAGWELVDRHPEVVSLKPHRIEGLSPGSEIIRFLPESVAAFDKSFTTLAQIARKGGPDVKELKDLMAKRGVSPAITWSEIGADIYRVSDVAKVLAN